MTKLEEIALAIHRARYPDAPVMDGIEGLDTTVALRALVEACAAVQAMREPTEAQYDALAATDTMWRDLTSTMVWQTYIDAILNEKPGA